MSNTSENTFPNGTPIPAGYIEPMECECDAKALIPRAKLAPAKSRVYFVTERKTESGTYFLAEFRPCNPKDGLPWQASRTVNGGYYDAVHVDYRGEKYIYGYSDKEKALAAIKAHAAKAKGFACRMLDGSPIPA